MIRSLRLVPILSVSALVLILNPNRTPLTWLVVAIGTVLTMILVEARVPMPRDQAQARRWFLYPLIASFLVVPFLNAVASGYAISDAVRAAGFLGGAPTLSFVIVSAVRRLAR
jgi:hypothetical protein